ncbi:DNA/RNA-binding protein KIN17 [Hibiscus syriacus]|uniref:DNA/RNA-binding protein KIN17 n=1 Tax=Hibiscus syriacus TaxID=106335 RepID=A0A6A2YDV1_HIBSY|nr:DNA/RNA-binding protein KIN17 [Hibiscus syriacus]
MWENDFLTPKAIANRIKAKGLQKLRWYCQMCQKQCRDENGFKCHCMSESHQRQMQIFGQNPDRIVSGYSEEFERNFLDLMKRSHRFSSVSATVVYNEFINDRHHVHMNSTQWATLTELLSIWEGPGNVRLMRRPKKAVIKELNLDSGMKIGFSLGGGSAAKAEKGESSSTARLVFEEEENEKMKVKAKAKIERNENNGRKTALEELIIEEEKQKERSNRKDYWLCEGIIVKVMSKALDQKGYYKQKEVVKKVIDRYIVNGANRGSTARLVGVDTEKFCSKVQIEKGIYDGRVLKAIEYEDICKVAQ